MSEFKKVKALLDELKIPYEEKDADYWKNNVKIPGKEDIIEELNKSGAKKIVVKPVLGREHLALYESGICGFLFTNESEKFIAFETD